MFTTSSNTLATPAASQGLKVRCAQLGPPGQETLKLDVVNTQQQQQQQQSQIEDVKGQSYRYLFQDNRDRLKSYIKLTKFYECNFKCFSTSEIINEVSCEQLQLGAVPFRRYRSETDLYASTTEVNSTGKDVNSDYVTYSCSTLAICGETLHSSQLPSPQTQSIRQINSLVFTDLDLIKSINKKVRDKCIKRRIDEFIKSAQLGLEQSEIKELLSTNTNVVMKRLMYTSDFDTKDFVNEKGEISINVADFETSETKHDWNMPKVDRNSLVLSWLQSMDSTCVAQSQTNLS